MWNEYKLFVEKKENDYKKNISKKIVSWQILVIF